MRFIAAITLVAILAISAQGQEAPKPGPEHALLKKRVGTWETTMKSGDMEHKGVVTSKMELGGLWLVGSMTSDLGKQKFYGKSMETYDAKKKKYVNVWFDSMSTAPMVMEGNYDKEKKAFILIGEGPGLDGKPTKWKSVTTIKDNDTMIMGMFLGDAKEPMFTVTYKRKK